MEKLCSDCGRKNCGRWEFDRDLGTATEILEDGSHLVAHDLRPNRPSALGIQSVSEQTINCPSSETSKVEKLYPPVWKALSVPILAVPYYALLETIVS